MKNKKSKAIANIFCIMLALLCVVMLSGIAIQQEQNAYAVENQQETELRQETEATSSAALSSGGTVAENKDDIGTLLDNDNKNNLSGINCIENKNYFLQNPLHGENDTTYNNDGVCTTVAMEMLMGYHNYYSDRRLIPAVSPDGTRFLNENYGEFSTNPLNYSGTQASGQGDPGIGTGNNFFLKLINYTWKTDYSDQNLAAVANGANTFVNDYASQIKSRVSISSHIFFKAADGIAEIDAGRPIILGSIPFITGAKNAHVAVAFGYATYDGEFGFLIHSGWGNGELIHWVPSSWIGFQIRMSVNHTHNLVDTNEYGNFTHRKFTCDICGYSSFDEMYTTNEIGDTITGIRYPVNSQFLTIPSRINGIPITTIGEGAFQGTSIAMVGFEDYTTLKYIRSLAFAQCESLSLLRIPDSVIQIDSFAFANCTSITLTYYGTALKTIGDFAFSETNLLNLRIPSSVISIGWNAFYESNLGEDFHLPANSQLTTIYSSAFNQNPLIKRLVLPQTVTTIKGFAFAGCNALTIYTECTSKPSGWSSSWNADRPVIWGCTLSSDKSYVTSFTKSASTITNPNAINGISNPYREKYIFDGWYTTADFTGTKYMDLALAPNGGLYSKWKEATCVVEGSLITLADGTQKAVEELTGNEQLLVWNLLTGTFDTAPILFIDSDAQSVYEVINLGFSDGTSVKVISEHAFWDFDLNKYVFLRRDAAQYIGHWFNKQTTDADGNMTWTRVQLISVDIQNEVTTAWSPVTYGHLCYYVNGMLSMPGATEGLINIFDVNPDTMKIDETAYLADIAEYGLFTYAEFAEIVPIPEEIFNAFGVQNFKVAIGKGILTWDMIANLVERYAVFF